MNQVFWSEPRFYRHVSTELVCGSSRGSRAVQNTPCVDTRGPGVFPGARLGLTGSVGPSDSVGDWQGLERGEELGEVPSPELGVGCRC